MTSMAYTQMECLRALMPEKAARTKTFRVFNCAFQVKELSEEARRLALPGAHVLPCIGNVSLTDLLCLAMKHRDALKWLLVQISLYLSLLFELSAFPGTDCPSAELVAQQKADRPKGKRWDTFFTQSP